jgi:hypothetical protein
LHLQSCSGGKLSWASSFGRIILGWRYGNRITPIAQPTGYHLETPIDTGVLIYLAAGGQSGKPKIDMGGHG